MESTTPQLRTIDTVVHGRYLVRPPATSAPWPALFSFHGYGEDAATNLAAVESLPDLDHWLIVAVQALHPFYTKKEQVVASWMTRQDRELAIDDNIRYVQRVVDAVTREFASAGIVFAGFSQGVAMAYRAAAHISAAGVIALAGDVPPDIAQRPERSVLPHVLLGRGTADEWYTEYKMAADVERLKTLATSVETCVFQGGHEWTGSFGREAGGFLARLRNGMV
jgi:predicted esterase